MGVCLVVLEGKYTQVSYFLVQSKQKCFLVLPIEVLRKHNHCQSLLQWQSSPSCQAQACSFTGLPICLVVVSWLDHTGDCPLPRALQKCLLHSL